MGFAKFFRHKKFLSLQLIPALVGVFGLSDGRPGCHHHNGDCAHEPSLPPLLQVTRDTGNPDRLNVEIIGNVEGIARIDLESETTAVWDSGAAPLPAKLVRGRKRAYGLRLPKTASAPRKVKLSLVVEDESGRPSMTVQQEVALDPEVVVAESQTPAQIDGISAQGEPVIASVPADAPQPTVGEVAP